MYSLNKIFTRNLYECTLSIILIINIILLITLEVSVFDQLLNLLITYGIYIYNKNIESKLDKNININQLILASFLFIITIYRSFWLHIEDNFIYLFLPLLLISSALFFNDIYKITNNFKPFLISFLFPISKFIFVPLAIIINPFSTVITWLLLNALGFNSVLDGQEIYYNNNGISVTFSCSGAGQLIFCVTAMIIFNFCFPLKNKKLFFIQLCRSFLFTFFLNIIRLFLLAVYSNTANSSGFSMFAYLHGGNGGLLFSFFSMLFACESYKRLYLRNS